MTDEAVVAHLLRRTGFGPRPGEVATLAANGVTAALDVVLAVAPTPLDPSGKDADGIVRWWVTRMASPNAGLHDKMMWFWHSHFTTSTDKVDGARLLGRQLSVLHRHALGSFRTMVADITVDPAMLVYLDGDGSQGDGPNENYARELMELFTLGRGHYAEADVRAGAKALAGWTVDHDNGTATFDESLAYPGEVTFLGVSGRLQAGDIARIVCDADACAPFVAAKLYRYLVGVAPTTDRLAELASTFRAADLNIEALVEAILRHPTFWASLHTRARFPIEWVVAATVALGLDDPQLRVDACASLGQLPFNPPNVAGWPGGPRWLAASEALARAAVAVQSPAIDTIAGAVDPVSASLARCSLYDVSATTRDALTALAAAVPDAAGAALVLGAAVASPEFAVA